MVLATCAKVTREALAQTGGVVAETTARAVATLGGTIAAKHIIASGALLQRAVGAAESCIAHAADVLHGIPRLIVVATSLNSELLLGVADTAAAAVVGADGTLASNSCIVVVADTLAGLAVASTLARALNGGVHIVGACNMADPGITLGTRALRAVSTNPCGLAVGACVTQAAIVRPTRAVSRASVRTISRYTCSNCKECGCDICCLHFDGECEKIR